VPYIFWAPHEFSKFGNCFKPLFVFTGGAFSKKRGFHLKKQASSNIVFTNSVDSTGMPDRWHGIF